MTTQERKKLAKAARALAMECVAGTAPEFVPGDWRTCALGEAMKRADVAQRHPAETIRVAYGIDRAHQMMLTAATWLQSGTDWDAGTDVPAIPGAVVFPLLALADELESAP